MSVAPDGSVVVRLSAAPWLVRHAIDGQPSPLAVTSDLDWVSKLVTAEDGSLYLGGTIPAADETLGTRVRIDHLSATGSTLGSARWALSQSLGSTARDESTSLGGLTDDGAGSVWALITADFGRFVGPLDENLELRARTEVPALVDESGAARDVASPTQLTVVERGQYLIQGGDSALWIQRGDGAQQGRGGWWKALASIGQPGVFAGGIAPAPNGGWFAAVGSGVSDHVSGHGFFHRGFVRLTDDGRRVSGNGDYFEPRTPPLEDGELRHVSLAVLADSVLLATLLPNGTPLNADDVTLSPEQPNATLVRYTLTGEYSEARALGRVLSVAAVGPEAAVVLQTDASDRYRLQRFDFAPLTASLVADGDACSASEDCASGACCSSATGLDPVTCSATGTCPEGDYCDRGDTTCDGVCLDGELPGTQGYCAKPCPVATDCPARSHCVNEVCMPTCSTDDDCPYRDSHCRADGEVSVCVVGS